MMKKIIFALILSSIGAPAFGADAWVKVNAQGVAIGGAIVCSDDVCGDIHSEYSRLTLEPGERYVLQNKSSTDGNVWGIGGSTETLRVTADINNNWTATNYETRKIIAFNPSNETHNLSQPIIVNLPQMETSTAIDINNPLSWTDLTLMMSNEWFNAYVLWLEVQLKTLL